MILDEADLENVQNGEYTRYLKLIQYWGYVIFTSGIILVLFFISTFLRMSMKNIATDLYKNNEIFLLLPFSTIPIFAMLAGWKLMQVRQNANNQTKGFFWLKIFWCSVILNLIIICFTM